MGLRLGLFAAPAVSMMALSGCFPPSDGREPPLDRIYFPVGLALSGDGGEVPGADGGAPLPAPARWLYVANSDFDLQFNAGSLQAYDIERLQAFVPPYCEQDADCASGVCDAPGAPTHEGTPSYTCVDPEDPRACGALGEASRADQLLAPGRCNPLIPVSPPSGPSVLAQAVGIGAFVTDIIYRACDPTSQESCGPEGRLFLPVRGDATLHWVDVNSNARGPGLDCGQGADGACDDAHRRGDGPQEENTRDLELPPEPYGIAADAAGQAIVVTHQVNGQVSLFVNDWTGGAAGGPRLAYIQDGLPPGAVAAAAIPEPEIVRVANVPHQPGFLVTFRNSPEVRLVRYFDDEGAEPERDFLEASRSTTITTNSVGFDSRGVAVDDRERAACEATCEGAANKEDCLRLSRCASVPLDVYVANRTPATLVIGQTQPNFSEVTSDDLPRFYTNVAMDVGASRVVIGDVIGDDGTPERRVFVVCFDSRKVFVYDPAARRVETIIQTGRGPQAFAVDTARGLGFVAHFTDSYVGVIDLDRRHRQRYGQVILNMGTPTPPRASK